VLNGFQDPVKMHLLHTLLFALSLQKMSTSWFKS